MKRATTQPRLLIADAYQSVCDYIPRASPLSRARLLARDPSSPHLVAAHAPRAASSHVPAPVRYTQRTSALHAKSKPKTPLSPCHSPQQCVLAVSTTLKTTPRAAVPTPPGSPTLRPKNAGWHQARPAPGHAGARLGVVGPPRQHGRRHALQEVARARRRLLALLRRDAAGLVDQDLARTGACD